MINVSKDWNPLQARLKKLLQTKATYPEAIDLCLSMHALAHELDKKKPSLSSDLWTSLDDETCRIVTKDKTSIAWNLWHLARIEDLVANILMSGGKQVFDAEWGIKMNTAVTDTGNAMVESEVRAFSREIDIGGLRNYRKAVGRKTVKILSALGLRDLDRKVEESALARIVEEKGVLRKEKSIWLIDYWRGKTIKGLLMMPITRHQIVHLNDCYEIKTRCGKSKN